MLREHFEYFQAFQTVAGDDRRIDRDEFAAMKDKIQSWCKGTAGKSDKEFAAGEFCR